MAQFTDIPVQKNNQIQKKIFLTKAINCIFTRLRARPFPNVWPPKPVCMSSYLVDSRCKGVWWWNLHSPACFDLWFGNTAFLLSPLHRDPFLPHWWMSLPRLRSRHWNRCHYCRLHMADLKIIRIDNFKSA